jgi:hypothetical protein
VGSSPFAAGSSLSLLLSLQERSGASSAAVATTAPPPQAWPLSLGRRLRAGRTEASLPLWPRRPVPSAEGDGHEPGRAGACVRASGDGWNGALGFPEFSRAARSIFFFLVTSNECSPVVDFMFFFRSLTGVFEVSAAACTAFLIKPFLLIGSVFFSLDPAWHARILFVGAFKVTYFRSGLLFSFVLWISCARAVMSSCEQFNSGRRNRNRYVML